MNSSEWSKLESLFGQVLSLEGEDRSRFLKTLREEDPVLSGELERLVDAYASAPNFFDSMMAQIHEKETENALLRGAGLAFGLAPEGTEINQYRIIKKLGQGGMGVVFLAEDTRLKRTVALKFLSPSLIDQEELLSRFMREAQTASAIDHPNICTIYEVNETDEGLPFIAMAYYEGETLKQILHNRIPSFEEALSYGKQLAAGLKKAHDAGIIHRDIKPDNAIITREGVLKILDFGLAKMSGLDFTRSGVTLGTIAYMSPEQASGKTVNHQTDIWSLGVVLYEMFTGERPFSGEYDQAVIYGILNSIPPASESLNPDLPDSLSTLISSCLEKEVQNRVDDAGKVFDELQQISRGEPVSKRRDTVLKEKPLIKKKSLALAGILVGISLVLVSLLAWLLARNDERPIPNSPDEIAQRLAVLPFATVGEDVPASLADGLVYSVTSKLILMERFKDSFSVIPASDVINEGVSTTLSAFNQLNANLVISGSVQQAEEDVRLTLVLSDAETNEAINSREEMVPGSEIGRLQDRIVSMLADLLDVQLAPASEQFLASDHTSSSQAYNFYTQAQGFSVRF